jgi:hypothetical protein
LFALYDNIVDGFFLSFVLNDSLDADVYFAFKAIVFGTDASSFSVLSTTTVLFDLH